MEKYSNRQNDLGKTSNPPVDKRSFEQGRKEIKRFKKTKPWENKPSAQSIRSSRFKPKGVEPKRVDAKEAAKKGLCFNLRWVRHKHGVFD